MILVYSTEKKMRHSQGIFRLFLGVADIMVGLIILPTTANTISKSFQTPLQFQTPLTITKRKICISTNESYLYKNATLTVNMLETTAMAENRIFPLVYKNSIGFLTAVSLLVSIYLLTVSGIDRLLALLKPLQFNQIVAKRFAISSSILCWCLAIFFSTLPFHVDNLYYNIFVSTFTIFQGNLASNLSLIIFVFPLLATWIISVSICLISRKIFAKRICSVTDEINFKQQRKLNLVLTLMIATFSFSVFPTVLIVVLLLFISDINPKFLLTYNSMSSNIIYSLHLTSVIILTMNSLWNCLIYNLRTKTFRKVAIKKYKKIWNQISCYKLFLTSKRKLQF